MGIRVGDHELLNQSFQTLFDNLASSFPETEMGSTINKYIKNHHARGDDRRKWRTKFNFKARASRGVRTVSPRAKRPAVRLLTINNVPSDVLEAIDELAARQGRGRSSYVRRELQRIVAGYLRRQRSKSRSKSRVLF